MFEDVFTQCFHLCLHHVLTHVSNIFEDSFHNVGGDVCNILLSLFKYLEIENKSKICLTNLDFARFYAPMHKFCAC